jgi:hypothetical protein
MSIEILDLASGGHRIPALGTVGEAVPEVIASEMAISIGQCGVQDQANGVDEIALACPVLADDDAARLELQVDASQIPKVLHSYAIDAHWLLPAV